MLECWTIRCTDSGQSTPLAVIRLKAPERNWREWGSEVSSEFVIEIGVALIGAAVTACLLGSLLNRQQDNAKQWRKQLRRRIRAMEKSRQG